MFHTVLIIPLLRVGRVCVTQYEIETNQKKTPYLDTLHAVLAVNYFFNRSFIIDV